mgnify:FL=1
MTNLQYRLTTQGQILLPGEVLHRLVVGRGSVLVWEWLDGAYIVRRDGKFTSAEIYAAVFGATKRSKGKATDVKTGVRTYIRWRHARG